MRGFRFSSILALLLWILSIAGSVWLGSGHSLRKDAEFQKQLTEIDGVVGEKRIFIYGSSGLLVGISAASLESMVGRSARNLATGGLGGQIDLAISLMNPHIRQGDVVIIGDRAFRSALIKSPHWYDRLASINKSVPLIPYLRRFIGNPFPRNSHGDLTSYRRAHIVTINTDSDPSYSTANIDVMRATINLVRQGGGCPVLVLVPILVKPADRLSFELATKQLLDQADSAGLSEHVLHTRNVETDISQFTDESHLSAKGREVWTAAIGKELVERNLCGVALHTQ